MVRPSRDRLAALARQLVDALARSRAVVLLKDREAVRQAVDQQNREVVLFEAQWVLDYTLEKNPHIDFRPTM